VKNILRLLLGTIILFALESGAAAQLSQSGGGGSTVSILQGGNTAAVDASGRLSIGLNAVGGTSITLGQKAMSASLPVVLASDQSAFTINSAQSGTWTVQPGNTANTTAWLVKTVPVSTCGTTAFDSGLVENIATGAGTDLATAATCVDAISMSNTTGSPVTITIKDKNGTPKTFLNAFSLPANSNLILSLERMKFVGGLTLISGTAASINAQLVGFQ